MNSKSPSHFNGICSSNLYFSFKKSFVSDTLIIGSEICTYLYIKDTFFEVYKIKGERNSFFSVTQIVIKVLNEVTSLKNN